VSAVSLEDTDPLEYADVALDYLAAGWNPLPVDPAANKGTLPAGFTGYKGRAVVRADVDKWSRGREARYHLSVRMPPGVVGVDIDQYDDKTGADNIEVLEAELGRLPATWASTSRAGTTSGIYLYRVPVGTMFPTGPCADVEFIQPHHRHAVVWPSVHRSGRSYRWYDPSGEESDRIPGVDELTELPWSWVERFQRDAGRIGDCATTEQVAVFLNAHTGSAHPKALDGIKATLNGKPGSRHDSLLAAACWAMREAAAGNFAASDAERMLSDWWRQVVDRQRFESVEFAEAIAWAVGQAEADPDRIEALRAKRSVQSLTTRSAPPQRVDPATGEIVPVVDLARLASNLTDEFWNAYEFLTHIRQAAQSRRVAPTAALGAVLARVAAFTPPSTCIPAFTGSTVPLSIYIALTGATGAGKSTTMATGADLLPDVPAGVVGPVPLGSGEGVADLFLEDVTEDDDGKKRTRRRKTRHGVLLNLDEGRVLGDMANRKGATLVPTLCTAWTGGDLGQANASRDTFRHVPAGSYSLGLITLWQPAKAGALFDDEHGGLPQRFLFLPTIDGNAPAVKPPWPGPLDWQPPALIAFDGQPIANPLRYADAICDEVDAEQVNRLNGVAIVDHLDAHRTLSRLKIAGTFAELDHRTEVTERDWYLAGQLVNESDRIRSTIVATLRAEGERWEQQGIERAVRREAAVATSAEHRATRAAMRAVGRRAHKEPGVELSRRIFTQAIKGADRALVDVDHVLELAVQEGWLERHGDTFTSGRSRPS
jgi:hypothetical protein